MRGGDARRDVGISLFLGHLQFLDGRFVNADANLQFAQVGQAELRFHTYFEREDVFRRRIHVELTDIHFQRQGLGEDVEFFILQVLHQFTVECAHHLIGGHHC